MGCFCSVSLRVWRGHGEGGIRRVELSVLRLASTQMPQRGEGLARSRARREGAFGFALQYASSIMLES